MFFFFFQAEDGIRDLTVTGVQTCALPICTSGFARETGGYAFLNTNDVRGAVDRIWRDASSYYLLGVQNPPVQRAADLREVEIKILRKGVNVRARRAIGGRP